MRADCSQSKDDEKIACGRRPSGEVMLFLGKWEDVIR